MSTTTLIRNATMLVTMDEQRREIADGALLIEDNAIVWVGSMSDLPPGTLEAADRILDAKGKIVLPGFVNTHHHFYQTLTRVVPGAQDAVLFDWLKTLYPIWAELTPDDVFVSTQLALTELLLSGCTTSSDHHYLWPNGCPFGRSICGSVNRRRAFSRRPRQHEPGRKQGRSAARPRDRRRRGDPAPTAAAWWRLFTIRGRFALHRVVLAPCSPFSVTPELMRESAVLARSFGAAMNVHLHTHLAETKDEEEFCLQRFGYRPGDYAEHLGWIGDDVWHAHCVHLNQPEVELFGRTHTGVAHCPTSNMRLASGIAPVRGMRDAGVPVGMGVDGSASNDGSHLLNEVRQCMLLQRVLGDPHAMTAREALEIATLGGAAVLGRDDIGALAPGMAADVVAFALDDIWHAGGAVHDPVAALVFCQPQGVDFVLVNGKLLVQDGVPLQVDVPELVERHNRSARGLMVRAGKA